MDLIFGSYHDVVRRMGWRVSPEGGGGEAPQDGAEAPAVPPPSHKYYDLKSGLTEIYLPICFAMPILIVNLV
jgi:hypothetical protein|eukprot:COSAG01_NODE_58210_length_307_cov_1.100962_2_plen_72_part_00